MLSRERSNLIPAFEVLQVIEVYKYPPSPLPWTSSIAMLL